MYWVPTSRIRGWVLGWTYLVSYSLRTSLCINAASLLCCEKDPESVDSCSDSNIPIMTVVATVVLGLGSAADDIKNIHNAITRNILNRQNSLKHTGRGSHTASSQTSLSASGCALDSADVAEMILERNRSGEDDMGDESTRTLWADGVEGTASTELSNKR